MNHDISTTTNLDASAFNVPVVNSPNVTGAITPVAISSHAGAGFFCQQIQQRIKSKNTLKILIAGCGAGHEAVAIQQTLSAEVQAVDVEDFVAADLKKSSQVNFQVASVCELPFATDSFDAIFYHHVIEHVDRPADSLVELHRVLRPGGWLFVGTPNRHRLISSIGAHQQSEWEATLANKMGDNLRDWKHRLTGRFRNELGAHAGVSQGELDKMMAKHFPTREWLTKEYLQFKYGSKRFSGLLPLVTNSSVCWFAAPAIYVFCQK